jgi:hypothetical protein
VLPICLRLTDYPAMTASRSQSDAPSPSTPEEQSVFQRTILIALAVTACVAFQLYRTAEATGNWEGMWFSLAHTAIVAVGTVLALRR